MIIWLRGAQPNAVVSMHVVEWEWVGKGSRKGTWVAAKSKDAAASTTTIQPSNLVVRRQRVKKAQHYQEQHSRVKPLMVRWWRQDKTRPEEECEGGQVFPRTPLFIYSPSIEIANNYSWATCKFMKLTVLKNTHPQFKFISLGTAPDDFIMNCRVHWCVHDQEWVAVVDAAGVETGRTRSSRKVEKFRGGII